MTDEPRRLRCVAMVRKRDTYRYAGGKRKFKMYYTKCQCEKPAKAGGRFCGQHQQKADRGSNVLIANHFMYVK